MSKQDQPGGRLLGLDLLRSVAIALVLVAHFGHRAVAAPAGDVSFALSLLGHLGVELFFVLSGFLIGNLLLDICDRGPTTRDWAVFMARRVMRTMPAYFLCLAVLLLLKPSAQAVPNLAQYLTFTQNLAWAMPGWFAVSWSLTIEEWYYLLFSITLLGLVAMFPRHGFWLALGGFLVVPLVLRIWFAADGNWDEDVRKVVLFRLDAIAYGVLLARLMRTSDLLAANWRASLLVGSASLAATMGYWYVEIGSWSVASPVWRVLVFNLVSIALALMFPAALRLRSVPGALATGIATTSTLSYGMYLYHSAMLDWVRPLLKYGGLAGGLGLVLAAVATVVAAHLSYRFFERPILMRRPSHAGRPDARPQPAAAIGRGRLASA